MDFNAVKCGLSKMSDAQRKSLSEMSVARWSYVVGGNTGTTTEAAAMISGYLMALEDIAVLTRYERESVKEWLLTGIRGVTDMEFVMKTM